MAQISVIFHSTGEEATHHLFVITTIIPPLPLLVLSLSWFWDQFGLSAQKLYFCVCTPICFFESSACSCGLWTLSLNRNVGVSASVFCVNLHVTCQAGFILKPQQTRDRRWSLSSLCWSSRCQGLSQRWVHVCQPQVLGRRLPVRRWRRLWRRQRRAQVLRPSDLRAQSPPLQHLGVRATHVELRRGPWLLWQLRRGAGALRRGRRPVPEGKLHPGRVPLRQWRVRSPDVEVWRRPGLQGQVWRVGLSWVPLSCLFLGKIFLVHHI